MGAGAELRQAVLDEIQARFPLEADPYGALARRLGATRQDVLDAVSQLRADGLIRSITASLSSRHLGYSARLCALAVEGGEEDIDRAADLVSAHPEITHNYLRNDRYNLWFTMIGPSEGHLDDLLARIRRETGVEDAIGLPSAGIFKIRVDFSKAGRTGQARGQHEVESVVHYDARPFDAADPFDIALVRWAQTDSAGDEPFAEAAAYVSAELGAHVDEQHVIERLREWKSAGVLRRFGAMVKHRKMGFLFNGMTVWQVQPDKLRAVGLCFAELPFVSHCYARKPAPTWPYNLYAMVHGKTQAEMDAQVDEMRALSGLEPKVLVSTKEYKKATPIYFA